MGKCPKCRKDVLTLIKEGPEGFRYRGYYCPDCNQAYTLLGEEFKPAKGEALT